MYDTVRLKMESQEKAERLPDQVRFFDLIHDEGGGVYVIGGYEECGYSDGEPG